MITFLRHSSHSPLYPLSFLQVSFLYFYIESLLSIFLYTRFCFLLRSTKFKLHHLWPNIVMIQMSLPKTDSANSQSVMEERSMRSYLLAK